MAKNLVLPNGLKEKFQVGFKKYLNARIAQMEEHRPSKSRVGGSSPSASTKFLQYKRKR